MAGQNAELEFIDILSSDNETFDNTMKVYESFVQNKRTDLLGNHIDTPEEIREIFSQAKAKMIELRNRITAENH